CPRPGQARSNQKPGPPWRKRHWHQFLCAGSGRQAIGSPAQFGPEGGKALEGFQESRGERMALNLAEANRAMAAALAKATELSQKISVPVSRRPRRATP